MMNCKSHNVDILNFNFDNIDVEVCDKNWPRITLKYVQCDTAIKSS